MRLKGKCRLKRRCPIAFKQQSEPIRLCIIVQLELKVTLKEFNQQGTTVIKPKYVKKLLLDEQKGKLALNLKLYSLSNVLVFVKITKKSYSLVTAF